MAAILNERTPLATVQRGQDLEDCGYPCSSDNYYTDCQLPQQAQWHISTLTLDQLGQQILKNKKKYTIYVLIKIIQFYLSIKLYYQKQITGAVKFLEKCFKA